MATLSTADFSSRLKDCVSPFAHRLSGGEMSAILSALSLIPARGIARTYHARRVFAVLSAVRVLRPEGSNSAVPNDALSSALGVSTNPQTWLTVQTVDAWLAKITTAALRSRK